MKLYILLSGLLISLSISAKQGMNIGVGGAVLMNNKFWTPEEYAGAGSYDFTLSYSMNMLEVGAELFENKIFKSGYSNFSNIHLMPFVKYLPFEKNGLFLKGGIFYSSETKEKRYKDSEGANSISEHGEWLGYGLSFGYQERLVRNTNLFISIELSFNDYLKVPEDAYTWRFNNGKAFYGLKACLVYKLDL